MKELQTVLNNILADKNTNLKPENLKKDVTCLGVTGTLEASASSGGVKQFSTVEEMNSSTGNTEGDLAIVYGNTLANMVADTETQYITFPDTVTLPTAFTEEYYGRIRAVDSSAMFDGNIMLNQTSFNFQGYSETGETMINYTSTDGITYTRSTTITNPVDLGTVVKPDYEWNDILGYFMQVSSSSFTGLYKYNSTAWELAPTGLTTVADEVYATKFYGKNGVQEGVLQNQTVSDIKLLNSQMTLWNLFNNITITTNLGKCFENNKQIKTIPLLNTSNVTDMSYMFYGCTNLTTIPLLDTSNVTDMTHIFMNCSNLISIPLLNTSKITSLFEMFYGCTNLTTIPLLDTSNVTNAFEAFRFCQALTNIPLLDTSNITTMNYMFQGCASLETIPLLNTSNAKDMRTMFTDCPNLSDDSLNNILAMCTNAVKITSNKTLKDIGLIQEQVNKCTTLSNYSAFTAAGWTTGY